MIGQLIFYCFMAKVNAGTACRMYRVQTAVKTAAFPALTLLGIVFIVIIENTEYLG